jgi:hypothetical protein
MISISAKKIAELTLKRMFSWQTWWRSTVKP